MLGPDGETVIDKTRIVTLDCPTCHLADALTFEVGRIGQQIGAEVRNQACSCHLCTDETIRLLKRACVKSIWQGA